MVKKKKSHQSHNEPIVACIQLFKRRAALQLTPEMFTDIITQVSNMVPLHWPTNNNKFSGRKRLSTLWLRSLGTIICSIGILKDSENYNNRQRKPARSISWHLNTITMGETQHLRNVNKIFTANIFEILLVWSK